MGGVIHLRAIVQSEESAKPGPSGSLTRGASLQAPPPRFLISRQVGRTVRVAAISACFFRRIGRAKCLETLDCGILMGRTDLLFCPRGKPRKAMAGLNTTGAVSLRVRIRLNPSQNVAFVCFESDPGDDSARRSAPYRRRPEGIAEGRVEQACRSAAHTIRSSRSSQPDQTAQR